MINFEQINYILLYFPSDSSFLIYHKHDTIWSEEFYNKLSKNRKVLMETDYEETSYTSIIVQCAVEENHLKCAQDFCEKVKREKKWSIDHILQNVPRFAPARRSVFPSLKVSHIPLIIKKVHLFSR